MSANIFKDLDVDIVSEIPKEYCQHIVSVLRDELQA